MNDIQPTHAVVAVNEADFQQNVLDSDLPVIVDFWAEWCIHCKRLSPTYLQLSSLYEGKARFTMINADDNASIPMRYHVQGLPTLLVFHRGQEVARIVGPHPTQLQRHIDLALSKIA